MVQATRVIDTFIMTFINGKISATPYFATIYTGLITAIKVLALATAIKLVKHHYFKQKEKERFEREKIEAELDLLKSQIHPGFLFNTLNNIYSFALTASPRAPQMLLKLSDILSYMLYECNEKEVPLEKEIRLLEDYITLEKMRYGNRLEVNMQVKGDVSKDSIAPLLLLGFVENSLKQISDKLTTQPWLNLALEIENDVLTMKLMNGKPLVILPADNGEEHEFKQIQRRLKLLYQGRYELKVKEEAETMMIVLRIKLLSATEEFEWEKQKEILESAKV
jgi:LytS/YehU family sensor histidine kinase